MRRIYKPLFTEAERREHTEKLRKQIMEYHKAWWAEERKRLASVKPSH